MDKNARNYLTLSAYLLLLFAGLLAVFVLIYRNFTLDAYNGVLFFLILLTAVVILCGLLTMFSVVVAYRTKHIPEWMRFTVRLGLKVLLPFTALAAGLFKGSRDSIRRLYVEVNNILVESGALKFKPEQVLVLLPHCLQNSECNFKITNDIKNCRQCGKCCVQDILRLSEEMGVKVVVVTGGTAARNIVKREKPGILVSVACERDLAVGIADVGKIPVIGVVNERPNGPCKDTTVNIESLRKKLEFILESSLEHGR